jgi:hypothetical protein
VLLVDPCGNESFITVSQAQTLILDGSAGYGGERIVSTDMNVSRKDRKLSCVIMKTAYRWQKDDGCSGGDHGMPYEPNGRHAQFELVRQ